MKQLTKDSAAKLKQGAIVFLKATPQRTPNVIELGPSAEHLYVPCRVTGFTSKKWVKAEIDLRDNDYYDLNLDHYGVFGTTQVFAPVLLKQPSEKLPVYYYVRSVASTAVPMVPDTVEEAQAATEQWERFLATKNKVRADRIRELDEWTKEQDHLRKTRYDLAAKANEKYVAAVHALHGEPSQFADWYIDVKGKAVHVHTSLQREAKGWKVDSLAYYWQGFRAIQAPKRHRPKKVWQEAIAEALVYLAYSLWNTLETEEEE